MKSFLRSVAEDIISRHGTDLSDIAVVFPNKRASLFMNRCLADIAGKPLFSPVYMTVNELFRSKSRLEIADNMECVAALYNVYRRIIPTDEGIDRFWGWGEIILSDFDDIDKHLADAELVLSNTGDLHAFDNIDYIDEEKREMLKRFFSEFSDNHNTKIKQRFVRLWSNLYAIYKTFNEELRSRNTAYEGALFRDVALNARDLEWEYKEYVFAGFNMLWEAERKVFSVLKEKGIARFYWDFDRYYVDDAMQEAGEYIRRQLVMFPNALDINDGEIYDNLNKEKRITFISAPTENIQARYAGKWLEEKYKNNGGKTTAVVLADERLLGSVIYYLPEEVSERTNITVGMPLAEAPVCPLVDSFLRLHIFAYNSKERSYLTKQTKLLLAHPYVSLLSEQANGLLQVLVKNRSFTATESELCLDEGLSMLFRPFEFDGGDVNNQILARLSLLLSAIGVKAEQERKIKAAWQGLDPRLATPDHEEQMMQEAVFQMYCIVNRLRDIFTSLQTETVPATLLRLINQLVASKSMPLHGEPVADLQITGVLETRNLDFDRLLVLSCNEGNIPKGVNSPSIIPYAVRKAHNLTTPERKTAIYAYYFYRLLQRSDEITVAYNSSTEDGKTGQMSRFMLQLMAETNPEKTHMTHVTLCAAQTPTGAKPVKFDKNETVMRVLDNIHYLSPSAINKYMRCPRQFYFNRVAGIKEPDCDDAIDSRMFGTILHEAARTIHEEIITPGKLLTREAIDNVLNEKNHLTIRRHTDNAIYKNFFNNHKGHYDGLQLINREVIVHYITTLLKADRELAPLYIEGLEKEIYGDISVCVGGQTRNIRTGGFIDRLDRIITPGGREVLRVVDYKTGGHQQKVLASVEEVFNSDNIDDKHSDYYFQAMLYSLLVRKSVKPYSYDGNEFPPLNENMLSVSPALLFIQKSESIKDPTLKFGDSKNPVPVNDILDYETPFLQLFQNTVAEIFSPTVPFAATNKEKRCSNCPYQMLCNS